MFYFEEVMVISFQFDLKKALKSINLTEEKKTIVIEKRRDEAEFIECYGKAKWAIVDLLNEQYAKLFNSPIDLYNWLNYNESDEVAYFLNEAGSNTLNYAELKKPSAVHLWWGKKGFVIGIEQEGRGFDAARIDLLRLRENEGAGFEFFRKCKGTVFFDDVKEAKIIYFMQKWK